MKDNYERLRKEYLNICDEDCGGDPSTGIQPCPFFEYEEGCLLKSEKFRAAPGGLNNLAAAVHENAVAHGWWEQERELPEILMLCVSELAEALEEYRSGRPVLYFRAMLAGYVAKKTEARIAEAGHTIRKIRTRLVRHRVKSRKAWRWNWPIA